MAKTSQKKPYLKTLLYGALSIASYVFLFANVDYVNEYFVKGGLYAALPIITAFYFSFVHGAFASYLISVLGLKAKAGSH